VVLFLHLLSVVAALATATVLHLVEIRVRAASTVAEIRAWTAVISKVVRLFPIVVLCLVGTGVYLAQRWSWGAPWIDVSVAGLVINQVLGNVVSASRGRALDREIARAPDELVPASVEALTRDPVAWSASLTTTGITVSIMFMMTTKPGLLGSVIVLIAGVIAGLACAVPFWARRREPHADVA
jgi:hypothetical protein